MTEPNQVVTTKYLSVWFWFIIGWISLMAGIIALVLKRHEFFMGLTGVFVICFLNSLIKKWRFENQYG